MSDQHNSQLYFQIQAQAKKALNLSLLPLWLTVFEAFVGFVLKPNFGTMPSIKGEGFNAAPYIFFSLGIGIVNFYSLIRATKLLRDLRRTLGNRKDVPPSAIAAVVLGWLGVPGCGIVVLFSLVAAAFGAGL